VISAAQRALAAYFAEIAVWRAIGVEFATQSGISVASFFLINGASSTQSIKNVWRKQERCSISALNVRERLSMHHPRNQ
jgi:hypothetical protein